MQMVSRGLSRGCNIALSRGFLLCISLAWGYKLMHFHTRFLCGLFSWCVPHTPGGLCANLRTVFTYFLSL